MKSYFKFIVSLIVILSFGTGVKGETIKVKNENIMSSAQQIDRLQKIKEKGVLTLLSANDKPYSYDDPKTSLFTGVDADILREVAKRLGLKKVDVKYTTFPNAINELIKNPDIDLFAQGIYQTEERKALVNFTNPIYACNDAIMVRRDSTIKSKDDLKNAKIGVLVGTVYEDLAKDWKSKGAIKDYIIFYDDNSVLISLENRAIDAILTDSIIAEYNVLFKENPKFRLLSPNQYKPDINLSVGYPLKKEDVTLLNAINEKLQEMKEDGALYEILAEHGLLGHYIP
ncbi:transporter substrate-binding domain-containing protein [Clostridium cibarium]|uniref:Amino acid ABC transporter substrate-binding protein n=1 Tax=Clostridium cibarium TaxID=2762247 RepID=A0ABR8PXI3_9CLOT|nr:amino acid ABC transporter substrate-binding protein [Clostridium cibarium]